MNILQVNYCDLPGRIFNGYDLQSSLKAEGIASKQIVLDKSSSDNDVRRICTDREMFLRGRLIDIERKYSMFNLLEPFKDHMAQSEEFKEADIVHYHIIHLYMTSLFSLDYLFSQKASVWTLHDPWALSGRCVHPLECDKWKDGCYACDRWNEAAFPTKIDKAHDLWKIKRAVFKTIEDKVDLVVSSDWMMNRIKESALTRGFKHIHKIPFGVEIREYEKLDKKQAKRELGICPDHMVISFRAEEDPLKGTEYAVQALKRLKNKQRITLLTTGHMQVEEELKKQFQVFELGWQSQKGVQKFLEATDVFLMPSLAESFGLMSIEAMASKCVVVVFKGTALEKVTFSPECGVAVEYKDVEGLSQAIEALLVNSRERQAREEKGYSIVREHYRYKDYVRRHIELYHSVLERTADREYRKYSLIAANQYGERLASIGEGIKRMEQLRTQIMGVAGEADLTVAIFSETTAGIEIYEELLKRQIPVAYVIGKNSWSELERIRPVQVLESAESIPCAENTVLILADLGEDSAETVKLYAKRIITRKEIDKLIEKYPVMPEICQLREIPDIDYSSEGIGKLIYLFDQTVGDICSYYEMVLKEDIDKNDQ